MGTLRSTRFRVKAELSHSRRMLSADETCLTAPREGWNRVADGFHLRRMQRIDLVAAAVLAPLAQQLGDALDRRSGCNLLPFFVGACSR